MLALRLAKRATAAGRRLPPILLLFAVLALLLSACAQSQAVGSPRTGLPVVGPTTTLPSARPWTATPAAKEEAPLPTRFAAAITLAPTLTRTPSPTPAVTPSPASVREPESPFLLQTAAGEPLALSLKLLANVDVHLTAGAADSISGDERFFFSSLDRRVYAYSAGGRLLWRQRMAGPVYTVVSIAGWQVAAGDDAGWVTLLDREGHLLWQHDLGARVTALSGPWADGPLAGPADAGLLAGGWDQRLTLLSLDPAEERVRWQVPLPGRVSDITQLDGMAVVSTMAGSLRSFDSLGTMRWQFEVGAPVTRVEAYRVGQDVVLAGVQDGRLIALSSDGELQWQARLGEGAPVWDVGFLPPGPTPAVLAATGGAAPSLSLLSMQGTWKWRLALPSPAGAVAVLDVDRDGVNEIVVGLADGVVVAYDGQGRRRASVQAGLPVWQVVPGTLNHESAGLVLADLNAWRILGEAGEAIKPRLDVPALVETVPPTLPSPAVALAAERNEGNSATLIFLGDVVPGRSIESQIDRYGAQYPWVGLGPMLREADLAIANLECVLSTRGRPMGKPYVIRAHPSAGQTLTDAGIDLVTLANNHVLDYGDGALDDTLGVLSRLNVAAIGAGKTADEARRPALNNLNGVRVAVLAYAGAYWRDSADMPASDRIAWADSAAVAAGVTAVRDEADVVVVILHAGKEYSRAPAPSQVTAAHAAIDAGADLVVGHHPHVTQSVERYGRGLIVYSLGNSLFDIPLQAAMQGDMLRVQVGREGLLQAELWPLWIDGEIQPRLLDDGQGLPRFKVIYP